MSTMYGQLDVKTEMKSRRIEFGITEAEAQAAFHWFLIVLGVLMAFYWMTELK